MKENKVRIQGLIVLAILFVVYTIIAFALPFPKNGVFFLAYLFSVVAFGMQIYVFRISFQRGSDVKSKFYGFPIAKIGVVYLLAQVVVSLIIMALSPVFPLWLELIILVVILAVSGVGVIAADVMRNEIHRQDTVLRKDVSSMRGMQSKMRMLAGQCADTEISDEVGLLSETLRYSDPVSSPAVATIEAELESLIDELQKAAMEQDFPSARELCKKASLILEERNRLCKLNK